MPKPYDVTLRALFQLEPAAWLEFLGIPVPDYQRCPGDRFQPRDRHRRGG